MYTRRTLCKLDFKRHSEGRLLSYTLTWTCSSQNHSRQKPNPVAPLMVFFLFYQVKSKFAFFMEGGFQENSDKIA